MSTTISWIKRTVAQMPEGHMFSTREMLGYGTRKNVDQVMRRLKDKEFIVRVARGLWVKAVDFCEEKTPLPTIEEIAVKKAAAFKKKVVRPGRLVILPATETMPETEATEFSVSGCSSSFNSVHGRVVLRQAGERKLSLGESTVGVTLRKLWFMGKNVVDLAVAQAMTVRFNRTEREEMRGRTDTLPQWLTERLLLFLRGDKPKKADKAERRRRQLEHEYDPYLAARATSVYVEINPPLDSPANPHANPHPEPPANPHPDRHPDPHPDPLPNSVPNPRPAPPPDD